VGKGVTTSMKFEFDVFKFYHPRREWGGNNGDLNDLEGIRVFIPQGRG